MMNSDVELEGKSLETKGSSERSVRVDLAAAYHLAEIFDMTELIWNHISARVPGKEEHFLINPIGFMYDEVTASNLVKIDIDGKKIAGDGRTSEAGFVIHSAVHRARPDVVCVMHSHTIEGVAVSCMEEGLLQLCGETAFLYDDVGYHDYEGISLELDERERIVQALGNKHALILRNHGLLTVGESVAEAFMRMFWLQYSCKVQLKLLSMGREFITLPETLAAKTAEQNQEVAAPGAFEWPALLRRLDRVSPNYKY